MTERPEETTVDDYTRHDWPTSDPYDGLGETEYYARLDRAWRARVTTATHQPGNPHELHTGARDACPDDRCRAYLSELCTRRT